MEPINPVFLPVTGGGWLAVTQPDSLMSVGVFGSTQEEARALFSKAVAHRLGLYAECAPVA